MLEAFLEDLGTAAGRSLPAPLPRASRGGPASS